MGVKGYFIQYKFIIPENLKHSSYTYQKLFRALYGYTQAVFKSNGKVYHYHRKGVLSDVPYIRPGKNCVIIPLGAFQRVIDFFKTGRNPAHQWKSKGEWKAVYYMNEKDVEEKKAAIAIEELLARAQILTTSDKPIALLDAMEEAAVGAKKSSAEVNSLIISKTRPVIESDWFKATHPMSDNLKKFYSLYKALKGS